MKIKQFIILLILFMAFSINAFSQDTIYIYNDGIQLSKVIEVLPTQIKFKKYNNIDGPLYTMDKSEILKIVYENGSVDVFSEIMVGEKEDKDSGEKTRRSSKLIIQGGVSYANLREDNGSTKHRLGFVGGLSFEIPIESHLNSFIDLTLLFEQKGSTYDDYFFEYNEQTYQSIGESIILDYFTFAATYKPYFGQKQILYGRIGFYAGYLYEATGKADVKSVGDGQITNINVSIKDNFSKGDFGGVIGLGINIPIQRGKNTSSIIFDFRYNLGISNIYGKVDAIILDPEKVFNSNILVMIGSRFSL